MLVGFDTADDSGVYKLSDSQALVQTLDFFTPIVDDPYWFGKIAAANSLSDVYAMGGTPLTALGIVCFPEATMPMWVLHDILRGADEVVHESGAVIIGGHSVKDNELKYGLSVTGIVDPAKLITNAGAQPGDSLYLTKPLGTGIVSTALKRDKCPPDVAQKVMEQMAQLNRDAAEIAVACEVKGMTDITGFGLLGHTAELARASNVTIELHASQIPIITEALDYAAQGLLTGGAKDNVGYVGADLNLDSDIDENLMHTFWDPQTSGGLLIAVPEKSQASFESLTQQRNVFAKQIGSVTQYDTKAGRLVLH